MVVIFNLFCGHVQPAFNDFFALAALSLTALAQAPLKGFARWRQHKNADRIGHGLLNLARTLNVNIEQQVLALGGGFGEEAARGSVIVAENFGMLQELTAGNHFLKFGSRDEEVFAAILLATPRSPRGVGDRKFKVEDETAQFIGERGL